MKTIQTAAIILISSSMILGCQKSNLSPAVDSSGSLTKTSNASDPSNAAKWLKPENFVSGVNNQYMPQIPGDTLFYQNVTVEQGDTTIEDIYVTTTNDIKIIQG